MLIPVLLTALLFALVPCGGAQTGRGEPRFEVFSIKHSGNIKLGEPTLLNGIQHQEFRPEQAITHKGDRLMGEVILNRILRYAYSPLVKPFHSESPDWMEWEVYQIQAIVPAGATDESVRTMLRLALAERLGLKCRIVSKEVPVFILMKGDSPPKLVPAAVADPDPGPRMAATFKRKCASVTELAAYIGFFTGTQVLDKTGIVGNYQFQEDWSRELSDPGSRLGTAKLIAKKFGLKLEAGRELQNVLVVDRANLEPIPN